MLDLIFGVGVRPRSTAAEPELEPRLRSVLDAVEMGEELAGFTGLLASDIRAALGRLELLGLVRRDGLGAYERTMA